MEIQLFERVHKLNKCKGEWCNARAKKCSELKRENASLKASVEQIMKTLSMQQINLPSNE